MRAYGARGAVYEETGRTEEAIADYRQAVALDPNDEKSKNALKRLGAELSASETPAPSTVDAPESSGERRMPRKSLFD